MKTYCEFTFDAAHSVAPYSGLHGHTFIVRLTFGGAVDEVYGWPVNLYDVENYIKEIKGEHGSGLDHGNLDLIPSPNEDDSSQFQSTGDVIQHGKRGGLLCRHRWRSDLITMPLA